ncbi:MAG: hypothetical protein ACI85F_000986 [Bacteroidia bacterium]
MIPFICAMVIFKAIASQLNVSEKQVLAVLQLAEGGATVPFISRYRKEATGGLDEVQVADIIKLNKELQEFEKRREAILKSVEEQDLLSEELKGKFNSAATLQELEDLYLPYKQKRKTLATKARELGLESLAKIIMKQNEPDPEGAANRFVKGDVESIESALTGARHIIAEWMNENAALRSTLRKLFMREAVLASKLIKGKDEEGEKFKDYFKYEERIGKMASHRLLAVLRGENEGILRVNVGPESERALGILHRFFVKGNNESSTQVELACADAYKRLLQPSLESEMRKHFKLKADEKAINIFASNLQELLMAAPVGQKRTLAIDPGFKSGCKVVCLSAEGDLLHNETVFPHPPKNDRKKAQAKIGQLVESYKIDAIAIGNGTAGRETEDIMRNMRFNRKVQVYSVNEAGASIYSTSPIARAEFPDYDVIVRGSVSIGRRLMDPLAELVKIDPQSIGVGQYQHDVDQKMLKESLDRAVESSVNRVGVNLNTASTYLLQYVSGLGPQLAKAVIEMRTKNGPFISRKQLNDVPRLGAKAFEQAAGFLRIRNADNPLDNSAVHPERYKLVEKMAKSLKTSVADLIGNEELIGAINLSDFVTEEEGLPTLQDIKEELLKPGLDPRRAADVFEFAYGLKDISDLKTGMEINGIVTNVTAFGAFVDVGVKQDGLVHISQLADRFVSDPSEIVSVNKHVKVRVMEVEVDRKRIGLSMKGLN